MLYYDLQNAIGNNGYIVDDYDHGYIRITRYSSSDTLEVIYVGGESWEEIPMRFHKALRMMGLVKKLIKFHGSAEGRQDYGKYTYLWYGDDEMTFWGPNITYFIMKRSRETPEKKKGYNIIRTKDGRYCDITFFKQEAIVPFVYRHGKIAKITEKMRSTIFRAAYDAAGNIAKSTDFLVFVGWTKTTVVINDDEIVIPVCLYDLLRSYKHRKRSNGKLYTKVYNAVRTAL